MTHRVWIDVGTVGVGKQERCFVDGEAEKSPKPSAGISCIIFLYVHLNMQFFFYAMKLGFKSVVVFSFDGFSVLPVIKRLFIQQNEPL